MNEFGTDTNVGHKDLIDRQQAIDEIDEWIKAFRENGHKESAADACLIQDGIIQLPSAQPERKWIPVSERLPELDEDGYSQKVLACFGNYSGCDILEYRATEGIGKWYIGDMDDSPEDIGVMVLAWMPLPERYKGEQYG